MKPKKFRTYVRSTIGLIALIGCTAALADISSKRLIITYKDSVLENNANRDVAASVFDKHAITLEHLREMALARRHVFRVNNQLDDVAFKDLMDNLRLDKNVASVEEDLLLKTNFTPNDSRYNEQWHYFETTGGINLPVAWDKSTGAGVIVAVVDTGYTDHVDLGANVIAGYDFISDTFVSVDGDGRDDDASDPGDGYSFGECGRGIPGSSSSWHGTHVSGTVAALTNNSVGVAGIAYDASIMPVRVLGKCGGYTSDIADGIIWASGGTVSGVPDAPTPAQVINMSLGGGGSCGSAMQDAINQANANGVTVVVAAGNEDVNASNSTPANCNGVITVAANDRNGNKAWYSNYGTAVEISAPGGDTSVNTNGVLSTLNTGSLTPDQDTYEFYQGTSMAAPHIAGIAALMYAANPDALPQEISDAMTSTARTFPGSCIEGCGAGIVDASAAIDAIADSQPPAVQERLIVRNLSGTRLSWTYESLVVLEGAGRLVFRTTGGTGDVDMYVRFGDQPTPSVYDCRPFRPGNDEICVINNPQAGEWFVGLRGRRDYSGVDLIGIANP